MRLPAEAQLARLLSAELRNEPSPGKLNGVDFGATRNTNKFLPLAPHGDRQAEATKGEAEWLM
jgi:hypothetical protein